MKTKLVRIGNSRGARIPATLLKETGLDGDVVLEAKGDHIEIRPAPAHPRTGWEVAARAIHEAGEDVLILGDFPNEWDEEGWTWPDTASGSASTASGSRGRSGGKSKKRARASSSRRTS